MEYVDITPLDVNQNLNLNNISWKSNILIKCFMLFIENFLQPQITLTIILHRYRILLELKEVKNMMCMDSTTLMLEP